MSPGRPPGSPPDEHASLHHCIRDLAALNALPSMCIGRSPDEALDLILDALPTALSCDLVYVALAGTPPTERAVYLKAAASPATYDAIRTALANDADEHGEVAVGGARLRYVQVDLPLGVERGRLFVARSAGFADDTDRVLVRSAANLVGTTLESARVLDAAHRKDEFLAVLGHELRNPLAPILTAVELLARNPTAAREQAVIDRNTRHLARLVDDLLDISRVTRGHVELRRERVALGSVLERAVEIASPLIARHHHKLAVADAEGLAVRGDPVRLAQVFGNLLTNAAKFTPAGGTIDVRVARAGERARVSVRDNGRGIPAEQARRIFEPFVQVNQRDALSGGLGLGLAIVNDLVARHGGEIRVESAGVGHGATFHVELPLLSEAASPVVVPVVRPRVSRVGVRVLVVDDNVDVAELIAEALHDEGFETRVALEARAAIEAWRAFTPQAAILDVGLPDMDGYDLARALREEHGAGPTLIAATGYGQKRDRVLAQEAGFDCHFVKPVSLHDLLVALDERVVAGRAADGARSVER
jgi:signal transduction histidine kinase/ActR/RegA family two-component response regulator